MVGCDDHEHYYTNNHYRRVTRTLRRGRLLLPPAMKLIYAELPMFRMEKTRIGNHDARSIRQNNTRLPGLRVCF